MINRSKLTSSISTGFAKIWNFLSLPSLFKTSLRKSRSSLSVTSSWSYRTLSSFSVSFLGSGGGAFGRISRILLAGE